ncbi:1-deoxy-D-xylulose-5-phosphate synthase [Thermodesulforhabdus norvegica]|uniref:1-deoxy-D-xylulose-5-phosphate synthase n=1 Tax=Thermodesulforhabdus norvegica TaxID=39841 RepID=A0A1I4TA18_9BACT|nr:1-deoxy-D-xylulose-5-phosphate synthase [Thermodesulforhabdus norvegica]SFM73407.1 1-deoxy-D-xylulose-5-phosphate synthase [Thermodesulforhabdus norvegica]
MTEQSRILDNINSPADLKRLSPVQLQALAQEIREEIIRVVSKNGGHLAPNLGVVELTLALHYVFESPEDRIIWDVGHQSYPHKLITGRREVFHTLRTFGGISGFPKRDESPHDAFGTGHASTSISSALGITVAKSLKGCSRKVVAVIGDGSMTGGMAFEALNHAGDLGKDLIVVLNDNEMSISPNVGALSSFLSRKLSSRTIVQFKKQMEQFLKAIPGVGSNILQWLKKSEDSFIAFFTPGILFQALKFHYIGPINGHRLERLIETFEKAKHINGPVLIHVLTQKGRGYHPAESNPTHFHGVGPFKIDTGESCSSGGCPPTYTSVFGRTLVRLAEKDPRIVAITAAMKEGTGLDKFAGLYPERFFDVGIAEQHAVTFAAGLATEGFRPVVAIYSTFLQRAYDQVVHDVALQNLPVVFAMDRGGIVGEDGPTHHGVFDFSYLRHIPNMVVMAPRDENQLQHMIYTALKYERGPIAFRYPRGYGLGVPMDEELKEIPIGRGEVLREGNDVVLVAIGAMVHPAVEAAELLKKEGIEATVIDARFVKPLDEELIASRAEKADAVVTLEENVLQGGFGSAILEMFSNLGWFPSRFLRIGIPDLFVPHGSQKDLRKALKLDPESIAESVKKLLESNAKEFRTKSARLRAIR